MLTHAPSTAPLAKSHNVNEGTLRRERAKDISCASARSWKAEGHAAGIQEFLYAFFAFLFGIYPYTTATEKQKQATPDAVAESYGAASEREKKRQREAGEGLAKTQLMASINKTRETGIVARDL